MDSIASDLTVRLLPEQVDARLEVEAPIGAPTSQRDVDEDAVVVSTSEASRSHSNAHTANDHQPVTGGEARSLNVERRAGEAGIDKGLVSSLATTAVENDTELLLEVGEPALAGRVAITPLVQPLVVRPEPSQFLALNLFDGNHDGFINTKDALLRYAEIGERFGRSSAASGENEGQRVRPARGFSSNA